MVAGTGDEGLEILGASWIESLMAAIPTSVM